MAENLDQYARHSVWSGSGEHTALLGALPEDVDELSAVVRNVLVHYRADGIEFTGDRLRGAWFVRNYVIAELAHRRGDELLLWDMWGAMSRELGDDLDVIDRVAELLLAAKEGDEAAERELAGCYRTDGRRNPGGRVQSCRRSAAGRLSNSTEILDRLHGTQKDCQNVAVRR